GGNGDQGRYRVQGEGHVKEGDVAGPVRRSEVLGVRPVGGVVQRQRGGEAKRAVAVQVHRGVASAVEGRLQRGLAGAICPDSACPGSVTFRPTRGPGDLVETATRGDTVSRVNDTSKKETLPALSVALKCSVCGPSAVRSSGSAAAKRNSPPASKLTAAKTSPS